MGGGANSSWGGWGWRVQVKATGANANASNAATRMLSPRMLRTTPPLHRVCSRPTGGWKGNGQSLRLRPPGRPPAPGARPAPPAKRMGGGRRKRKATRPCLTPRTSPRGPSPPTPATPATPANTPTRTRHTFVRVHIVIRERKRGREGLRVPAPRAGGPIVVLHHPALTSTAGRDRLTHENRTTPDGTAQLLGCVSGSVERASRSVERASRKPSSPVS